MAHYKCFSCVGVTRLHDYGGFFSGGNGWTGVWKAEMVPKVLQYKYFIGVDESHGYYEWIDNPPGNRCLMLNGKFLYNLVSIQYLKREVSCWLVADKQTSRQAELR